ncbi:uncharacterized protein [Dermacentor albipictus]|uniref:uncharacterized protein n=1 Tax=Dermacentor albipictus TaxID=60249 RepID=UPI0038FCD644
MPPDQTGFRQNLDFINLRRAYGQPVITEIRQYISLTSRASAFKNHLNFNLTCKSRGLIPRSLRLNRPVRSSFGFSVVAKAEKLLLQARILECRQFVRNLQNEAFFARRRLEHRVPDEFASIQLHANFKARLQSRRTQETHERKLARLSPPADALHRNVAPSAVHNLWSHKPNSAELAVLSLGLNFNLGPQKDAKRLVCAVENAISQIEPSKREEARTRTIGILSRLRAHPSASPLSAEENKAIKDLRSNQNLVILPADKGNATVLLNRTDYRDKMLSLLADEATYSRLKKDPTLKIQRELQKLLTDVFRFVDPRHKGLYFSLLCTNGSAPALYERTPIDVPDLKRLLLFCLENTYFTFEGTFYSHGGVPSRMLLHFSQDRFEGCLVLDFLFYL